MRPLEIDGSYGEGGGQVLRTSLALSALCHRPIEVFNIRAGRSKPGLRPQHLTAVRALAAICRAEVRGDALNSQWISFSPSARPAGGSYCFDVREMAQQSSAGSMTLIAQTLVLPLSFAEKPSEVVLRGGTHVPWSPPWHYLQQVFLPTVGRQGLRAAVDLKTWGWYPVGSGEFNLAVQPVSGLGNLVWDRRGDLVQVTGTAAVTNLPAHIPQRMARRATNLLREAGFKCQIQPIRKRGPAAGAGIFLTAEYECGMAGFSALGRKGKAAERVAEEACRDLIRHHQAGDESPVDPLLADQLILPLAVAKGDSVFRTSQITQHALTNIHVVESFLQTAIQVERRGDAATIRIRGVGLYV